jgi:uncharacterized coiled-coil protein SlyX
MAKFKKAPPYYTLLDHIIKLNRNHGVDLFTIFYYWVMQCELYEDEDFVSSVYSVINEKFEGFNKANNINAIIIFFIGVINTYSKYKSLPDYIRPIMAKAFYRLSIYVQEGAKLQNKITFVEAVASKDINQKYSPRGYFILSNLFYKKNTKELIEVIEYDVSEEEKEEPFKNHKVFDYDEIALMVHSVLTSKNQNEPLIKNIQEMVEEISDEELNDVVGNEPSMIKKLYAYTKLLIIVAKENDKTIKELEIDRNRLDNAIRGIIASQRHDKTFEELENRVAYLENLLAEKNKEIHQLRNDEKSKTIEKLNKKLSELQEKYIALSEENNSRKELINELMEQDRYFIEEDIMTPLEEPIDVIYFGLRNMELYNYLKQFNILLYTVNPTVTPDYVPEDKPIVFNIDVAKHVVWWKIKHLKPLLVTGSNAERLGNMIYRFVKERWQ